MWVISFRIALSVKARLVYSLILWRFGRDKGTSRSLLAKRTGMDKARTLPAILDELFAADLITMDATKTLFPKRPAPDVVYWRSEVKDWWRSILYFKYLYRSSDCPLSLEQSVIFALLKHMSRLKKTWQTTKGIATLLGISRQTVVNGLKKLNSEGAIGLGITKHGFAFQILNEMPHWWIQPGKAKIDIPTLEATIDPPKKEASKPKPKAEPIDWAARAPDYNEDDYKTWRWGHSAYASAIRSIMEQEPGNKWLQDEFPQMIFLKAFGFYLRPNGQGKEDPMWFARLVADAKRQHAKTGKVRHCGYLVLSMLDKAIENGGSGFDQYYVEDETDGFQEAWDDADKRDRENKRSKT